MFRGIAASGLNQVMLIRLLSVLVIVVIAGVVFRRQKSYVSGTSVVLKKFRLNRDPSAKIAVEIVGRREGVVSWFLSLLKLEPNVRLVVTDSEVSIQTGSLSGISNTHIPLTKLYAVTCGYQRSILAIAGAALFAAGFIWMVLLTFASRVNYNIGPTAIGLLGLAMVCAIIYYLSKRIGIAFETSRGHGVTFKRSVIENVSVDLPEALEAIDLINARIHAIHGTKAINEDLPA
jgi:hypothetical protein